MIKVACFLLFLLINVGAIGSEAQDSDLFGNKTLYLEKESSVCSGVVGELDGDFYGFTNSHCFLSKEDCSSVRIQRSTPVKVGSTEEVITHACEKVVFSNRHIDLAVFKLSEPTNRDLSNKNLPAFSVLDIEDYNGKEAREVFALGHPLGAPIVSLSCSILKDVYSSLNGFMFSHSCKTKSGMSGGGLVSQKTGRLVGLNKSGSGNSGTGVDLSFLKPTIIEHLRGNTLVSGFGKFEDEFIVLNGLLTITYLDDEPAHKTFVERVDRLYRSNQDLFSYPIEIQIDDRVKDLSIEGLYPFDYLKVPSDISDKNLLYRIKELMKQGTQYQYWGSVLLGFVN